MHPAPALFDLPARIWVVGPCGTGKSTVARRLAHRTKAPVTHLDDIHWRPGWVEVPEIEEQAALAEVVRHPRWVIDGNYAHLRHPYVNLVDLFVWLDLPLRVTLPRLLRRCLVRTITREPCCNGNRESLTRTFLRPDSILLWAIGSDRPRRRSLEHELGNRPHVGFGTQRAIDDWLARVAP